MPTVGVYEAKTKLPELLRRVAKGERFLITRHGVPVAVLQPVQAASRRDRKEVIAAIEAFAQAHTLGDLRLRDLIEEGRV